MRFLRALVKPGTLLSVVSALSLGLASPDVASACSARIGDFVWVDTDRDGVQDAGEPGIPNVVVTLWDSSGTQLLKTTQTDANGYYLFSNVNDRTQPPICEATYVVRAAGPTGFLPTLIGAGGDPTIDSNDPLGATVTPTDVPDADGVASDTTIDFGFVPPCTGAIGDFVWNDLNNNGVQDAGEPGLEGVVVTGGSASTQTNANGYYQFTGLCAGTYPVCAAIPTGFQPSPANALSATDLTDSDGISNGQGQSCVDVTLPTDNSSNQTIDFGFWHTMVQNPGTGTPGYWKNHPEAWPVDVITIGGVTYTKDQAIALMGQPDGDKTNTIFRALVSAKLNVLIGNDDSCISTTIAAADSWMAQYGPVGSGVKARSLAWKIGEPLYWQLDAYNNGDLCAPHRD